jgi:hypothetical protein
VYYANGTEVVAEVNMSSGGGGVFSYTHVFTELGGYYTKERCDFEGVFAEGSTSINVVKQSFGDMQVIAQGVAQVDLNETVISEWIVLLPNATNVTNGSVYVMGGVCDVLAMDGSLLGVNTTTVATNNALKTSFITDPVVGFEEGENYQVMCNITLSQGLRVDGVKNFVYVNSHKTFWEYILALFGFAQRQEATANETLSIVNQTLQIVQSLNVSGTPAGSVSNLHAWVTT